MLDDDSAGGMLEEDYAGGLSCKLMIMLDDDQARG